MIPKTICPTPNPLVAEFNAIRGNTMRFARSLSDEDCCVQSMPDASPIKWHLAHTTWFFETFVLEKFQKDFKPHHPAFRVLFNSYYNGVGEKHPRAQRGLITRPSLREVFSYRKHVDNCVLDLIESSTAAELFSLIALGLQHEQQHQELMLTDVKHLFFQNPMKPAYENDECNKKPSSEMSEALSWRQFEPGIVAIGHTGDGFCFDNEMPRHRQFIESFSLASRLVSNGEYLAFVQDGAYADPGLWLAEGWDWVQSGRITHPIYWQHSEDGWKEFTLQGMQILNPEHSVLHLSYFEADAFARWAGARLPTEFEWEHAAQSDAASGCGGFSGWTNVAWQWTSSSYAPYPGYTQADGSIGEYNGKFMVNQYVLRGGSSATPDGHVRLSYRNFFPATARWQVTGVRLARS